MQDTWHRLQQQVCPLCIDGDGHGKCRLPVDEECALHVHAEEIVRVIRNGAGRQANETAVRERVCVACGLRDADGSCWKRNRLECAFDRFLTVIVEIMEGQTAGSA